MTLTTAEKANVSIVRTFFNVGPSKGDIPAADSLLTPDLSLHVPLPVSGLGIDAINNVIITCRAAFGGLYVTIDDIMADGDKVICRFSARGVHSGEFMGLPPTNREIVMTGIEIFRLRDGKIAELWGEANLMGLMHQLGMMPAPA
jgi:predicted ester cyclase